MTTMKTTVAFSLLATFGLWTAVFGGPALPDDNIGKNFKWCGEATQPADRLARYEAFWTRYHPKDEEYGDAVDFRLVRRTGYQLATLYSDQKNTVKCREMLKWLEATDQLFR